MFFGYELKAKTELLQNIGDWVEELQFTRVACNMIVLFFNIKASIRGRIYGTL